MGHADSPARSNFAARPWYGQKSSVVGRNKKSIRSENRSANHFKLRSSQRRRRRRQPFAQARDRTARTTGRTLNATLVLRVTPSGDKAEQDNQTGDGSHTASPQQPRWSIRNR